MMEGIVLPVIDGDEAARLVRALGKHRYVAGRLIVVHALAIAAADPDDAWARELLATPGLDLGSRDERLFASVDEERLAHVLGAFWGGDAASRAAVHERLASWLERAGLPFPDSFEAASPFDESAEDEMFPVLVDAGWELLRLAELDPQRHAGAIGAYGDAITFESARFEEENAVPPRAPYVQELPALGANELLRGVDPSGALVDRLHLFVEGEPIYQDYVTRGVLRAAKLSTA